MRQLRQGRHTARPSRHGQRLPNAQRASRFPTSAWFGASPANYPGHIAGAAIALLIAAGGHLRRAVRFKLIIDAGSPGDGEIARWFQYLLFLVVLMALATAVRFYFVSWLGERVVADIRLAVNRNLLRLAPGFFEENRPAEITSRITVDTTIIEQVVGTTVSVALRNLVMGIACAVILFVLAPKLAAMMLIGIALIVLPLTFLGRQVRAISKSSQDRIADIGTVTGEMLGAMKIVQAFNQQDREAQRFASATEAVFSTAKKANWPSRADDLPHHRAGLLVDHLGASGRVRSMLPPGG